MSFSDSDIWRYTNTDAGAPSDTIYVKAASPTTKYKLYFHVDESTNAYLDGEYSWQEALARKAELLKYYPSVSLDGVRYWQQHPTFTESEYAVTYNIFFSIKGEQP
jgi:hypothetical protein